MHSTAHSANLSALLAGNPEAQSLVSNALKVYQDTAKHDEAAKLARIFKLDEEQTFQTQSHWLSLPPSNHGCQAGIQESGEDSRTRALGSGSRLESGPPVLQRGFKCPDCRQLAIIPDPGCPIVATSEHQGVDCAPSGRLVTPDAIVRIRRDRRSSSIWLSGTAPSSLATSLL